MDTEKLGNANILSRKISDLKGHIYALSQAEEFSFGMNSHWRNTGGKCRVFKRIKKILEKQIKQDLAAAEAEFKKL